MNALAPRQPAPSHGGDGSRVQKVSASLERSAAVLEEPFARVRGVLVGQGVLGWMKGGGNLYSSMSSEDRARSWVEVCPTRAAATAIHAEAVRLNEARTDMDTTRLLIGLMLDAFPTAGRETRDGYFATLVHEIATDGHSPTVVAVACRRLRRTLRFPPTVAEMLDECSKVRAELARSIEITAAVVARATDAERLLANSISNERTAQ